MGIATRIRNVVRSMDTHPRLWLAGVLTCWVVCLVGVFRGGFVSLPEAERIATREQITRIAESIHLGEAIADLSGRYVTTDYPPVTVSWGERYSTFTTPSEFGATNWMLWVESAAGQVVAVRMRTGDGITSQPTNAPADRVQAGYEDSKFQPYTRARGPYADP